jgi:hypothetical protein
VVLVAVVTGLGLAVVALVVLTRPRWRPPTGGAGLLDPFDVAELADRFDAVHAEHARGQQALLQARLEPLVTRQVPVRRVEAIAELRSVRVRFADGTAVMVRGEVPGDAGVLAAVIRRHEVVPSSWSTGPRGTRVVFDWSNGRRHLAMLVSGLDQAV